MGKKCYQLRRSSLAIVITASFYIAEMKGGDLMGRGRIYNNFYTPELWAQVNKENKLI